MCGGELAGNGGGTGAAGESGVGEKGGGGGCVNRLTWNRG